MKLNFAMLTLIMFIFCGCIMQSSKNDAIIDSSIPDIKATAAPKTMEEPELEPTTENTNNIEYVINLDVDPKTRIVTGIQKVKFTNVQSKSLYKVYFNLYLNAFKKDSKIVPYFDKFKDKIFENGIDYGYIEIQSVSNNNEETTFNVYGTTLEIDLTEPLVFEETTEITLQFEAYIPLINENTGANSKAMWFGNFLPTLSVYDKDGFNIYPNYPAGDSFYTEIANYSVNVTVPNGYDVCGTGISTITELEDKTTTSFTAHFVRDFAFAISKYYKKMSYTGKSDVEINMYYYSNFKDVQHFLELAEKSLNYYSQKIGNYPYQKLDIIECELSFPSGMEYPQVIFMDSSYLQNERSQLTLVHEVCHQWFYNIIGNNQVNEAWIDEGFCSLLAEYILNDEGKIYQKLKGEYDTLSEKLESLENKTLLDDISVYKSWSDYYNVQYLRSKLMLYSLKIKMGDEKFEDFLKKFYTNYAFKIASKNDIISIASEVYGSDLTSFFKKWIEDNKMPALVN